MCVVLFIACSQDNRSCCRRTVRQNGVRSARGIGLNDVWAGTPVRFHGDVKLQNIGGVMERCGRNLVRLASLSSCTDVFQYGELVLYLCVANM